MSNIEKIEHFFDKNQKRSLILNSISEELDFFYIFVLRYFSKLSKYKLEAGNSENKEENLNFFTEPKIHFYKSHSKKLINDLIEEKQTFILITDYKNYKKYKPQFDFLNGYEFKKDINEFINNILKIKDKFLIEYCIENPALIYSETEKYFISQTYKSDYNKKGKDFILDIRRNIFQTKKEDLNPKKIYDELKEEVKYKKLNFLTY